MCAKNASRCLTNYFCDTLCVSECHMLHVIKKRIKKDVRMFSTRGEEMIGWGEVLKHVIYQ